MIHFLKYNSSQNTFSRIRLFCLGLIVIIAFQTAGLAQTSTEGIRFQVEDGNVYIYHTMRVPAGYGFNIYRSQNNSEFKKLNEEPVLSAANINEFMGIIGELASPLQKNLELDTPEALYMRLRASRLAANLTTFYYPEVAIALGHLFIDNTAKIGESATYRIEVVSGRDEPTGDIAETRINLAEVAVPQPFGLSAEHEGRKVTLYWKYPTSEMESDDKVVRFNIYDKQGDNLRQLNTSPIIRINNFEEFDYIFTGSRSSGTLNLVVAPVTLTGTEKSLSEVFTYELKDNEAPSVIDEVRAISNNEGEVRIAWIMSTEADAAGYNLYRSKDIRGGFKKINNELIPLLETYYIDNPQKLHTTYFYRVTAVDDSGNESKHSNAAKADVVDRILPLAPQSLHAETLENGTVKLSWKETEKKSNFQTYILFRNRVSENVSKAAFAIVNNEDIRGNSYIDLGEASKGFVEGAYYEFRIVASDSVKNLSDSVSTIIQIPDLTPPVPPTNIVAENKDGVYTQLRWGASLSTDVGEYLIYKGTDEKNLSPYKTLPNGVQYFRDDSVQVSNSYFYSITAKDTLGNESIRPTPKEIFVRDNTPPRTVRNVRAEASGQRINITWEPVNIYDLAGYQIYYSTTPSGVYEPLNKELVTETEFSTTEIALNSWVQVRAIDTSGNESNKSKPAGVYIPAD